MRRRGNAALPGRTDPFHFDTRIVEASAAAHLIHASSEGRFKITWCPGELTREEIEGSGFAYADLDEMMERYNQHTLSHGWNTVNGEELFFIAYPGLGLWAHESRLSA